MGRADAVPCPLRSGTGTRMVCSRENRKHGRMNWQGGMDGMKLRRLRKDTLSGYTTFGCMWKKGSCTERTAYSCTDSEGGMVPIQSRITAYWPDGSVKWTAHTAQSALLGEEIEVLPKEESALGAEDRQTRKPEPEVFGGEPLKTESEHHVDEVCSAGNSDSGIILEDSGAEIKINNGRFTILVSRDSDYLFDRISTHKGEAASNARAVLQLEEPAWLDGYEAKVAKPYTGVVNEIEVEEQGALQCILKYTGCHKNKDGEEKIPFVIRMYIHMDCPDLHFTHTFLYDGDEDKDFLKGLGITFEIPLSGVMYNRHIKVQGDHGVFHEVMAPLTAWRPHVPGEWYEAQMRGEKISLEGEDLTLAGQVLKDTPYWSSYDVCQDSPSHFIVRKKLAPDSCCYIDSLHGKRTKGAMAFGSEAGSVLVCIRDFWEKYPSGYTVKGMDSDRAECSVWFWSPSAAPMDFRHYAERGYNQVCYEGYDYKGATPNGIACTNECIVSFSDKMIPEDETVLQFSEQADRPPVYVGTPEFYHEMHAFGYWSLPSGNTETERWLEEQLERAFDFYKEEVEQRNWYGMFNYGDIMHTYDYVRHQWKYDIGGYAWDNTELVPTLWLWLYFMRTGREDVFTFAEKLSRHASEVDVYHMGKYKGLGSRHNVRHWGCPCKEARIAMASHHRYLYYMTGDRRLEDIFEELKDNELSFLNKDPLGDFFDKKDMVYPSHARSGPDWSSLCSNWMTQWERFNDKRYLDKIRVGIEDIKQAPLQLVSGPDFEFDPLTCRLRYIGERTTGGCHLQICMGAPQVWTELGDLMEDEEWKRMVADLGRFYYLPREEQLEESGGLVGNREFSLPFMASGIAAYGAWYLQDDVLAMRTWKILLHTQISNESQEGFRCSFLRDCGNQELLKEIPWITTNFVAQFCLNVIMALEFIKDKLPKTMEEAVELVSDLDDSTFRKA